jgi:glycine oxidase
LIGLSLAYDLAGHGLRVQVIDRGEPGREASWAGAGILPPANLETAVHPWEQLRGLSHRLHPQWAEELRRETGIDMGYRRCGAVYFARLAGEAASLIGLAATLAHEQIETRRLDRHEMAQIEPALLPLADSGSLRVAYFVPAEAQLRNPHHLRALAVACVRRGVRLTARAGATDFEVRGGKLVRVLTEAGPFEADRFCITSGAWTYKLLQQLGISTGIMPVRGQMVLFRCQRKPFQRILNEGPRYLVPREDGRVLVGSSEEEAGYDKSTTAEVLDELIQLGRDIVPELQQADIEQTWSGLRPGTFDGLPYLGTVPGLSNAFVAAGHFRSGLHTSPATAVVIGQLMRGETPQIDLEPFRVGRG